MSPAKKRPKAKKKKTARTTTAPKLHRSCATMPVHMLLLEQYPSFHARQFKLEEATQRKRTTALRAADLKVVTIKVIVHVVYREAAQNISLAQIKGQIAALNRDFRATNPDKSKVPVPFKGLISDARIQFSLHKVTRTLTTTAAFGIDNGVKKAATGGSAPVSTGQYLNIWVCALSGGLLGYAQFPGGPVATDGVVINYRAFGTTGTAQAPFNKGRTLTHEVGHYLNLRHIWGDTDDCSGSDLVADTPNCAGPNFGKPSFPTVSCNNGPSGDMFMNYMDYVDDGAMFMFSMQQVVRMRATLDGPRRSLWS
ncbi:MAG: zinc metalloprotease [Longimicrobiales bacterium]